MCVCVCVFINFKSAACNDIAIILVTQLELKFNMAIYQMTN